MESSFEDSNWYIVCFITEIFSDLKYISVTLFHNSVNVILPVWASLLVPLCFQINFLLLFLFLPDAKCVAIDPQSFSDVKSGKFFFLLFVSLYYFQNLISVYIDIVKRNLFFISLLQFARGSKNIRTIMMSTLFIFNVYTFVNLWTMIFFKKKYKLDSITLECGFIQKPSKAPNAAEPMSGLLDKFFIKVLFT